MDYLNETTWDVVISGTGLPQSLLALALSKSNKKVLHVDKNDYYGGTEAALSLDDAARWVKRVQNDASSGFDSPLLTDYSYDSSPRGDQVPRLGTSNSYSLSLSPQIIYARSKLLSALVSSGTHQQLEFQAVGSWWLCKDARTYSVPESSAIEELSVADRLKTVNTIQRIPSSREDVFADATLDIKSKRALMKFLRSMVKEDSIDPASSFRLDDGLSEDSNQSNASTPAREDTRPMKKRTKTGCLTCRKRRISCDEAKPVCNNCVKSKRSCEGYNPRLIFTYPFGHLNRPNVSSDPPRSTPISKSWGENTKIPSILHDPLLALSLIPSSVQYTPSEMVLSRIRRHLVSLGVFGAGFAAVTPKWGGISEIAQIGCRAGAVGGGTYALVRGIVGIEEQSGTEQADGSPKKEEERGLLQVELSNTEKVKTRWVAASPGNIPQQQFLDESLQLEKLARSISIVSSSLESLFPATSENGPMPACAIVMLPDATTNKGKPTEGERLVVYLSIHSSDTGEVPSGQCVIYASTTLSDPSSAYPTLDAAVKRLVTATAIEPPPTVLWQLHYIQHGLAPSFPSASAADTNQRSAESSSSPLSTTGFSTNDLGLGGILMLPPPSLDLAFDDRVVDAVKEAWAAIVGVDPDGPDGERFMVFERGPGNEEEEEE